MRRSGARCSTGLSEGRTWGHHLRTVGRLRDGSSIAEAARETATLGRAILSDQRPETYAPNAAFTAVPLRDDITRAVKPALLAVLAAVTLVLLIACVNVTNLLLARGVHRRAELALRAALGAGKGRLIRQLLTESVLLAALGGLAGMLVASLGLRGLVALSPANLPRAHAIAFHPAVFGFGLAVTTLLGSRSASFPPCTPDRPTRMGRFSTVRTGRRERTDGSGHRWSSRKSRSRWCCSSARDCCCAACSSCSPSPRDSTRRTCSRCRS